MLKTRIGDEVWLVHQPDHARVSGYLAAHWGNREFLPPGSFGTATAFDNLRAEVVYAIAEHDNGWWEWEANPEFDAADGLPLHLPDVARTDPVAGLERWRRGIPRLRESHPYAALLVSQHAYWLYAFAFDDLPDRNEVMRHPIFGQPGTTRRLVNAPEPTRAFLSEQRETHRELIEQLASDSQFAGVVDPDCLLPHVRLLQLLDALSLLLSFGGTQGWSLHDIPRRGWDDRVPMHWRPSGNRQISLSPYPFDLDPLEVFLPVRVLTHPQIGPPQLPIVHLHSIPITTRRFELHSG